MMTYWGCWLKVVDPVEKMYLPIAQPLIVERILRTTRLLWVAYSGSPWWSRGSPCIATYPRPSLDADRWGLGVNYIHAPCFEPLYKGS